MALQSVDNIVASIAAGKTWKASFQKVSTNAAASAAGRWHELYTATGVPGAGVYGGSVGVAQQMKRSTHSCLDIGAPVPTDVKHLMTMNIGTPAATTAAAMMILVDCLINYPSCVVTGTATTLNNTATLPRYTDGKGVMAIVAVQALLGAAAPALTFTYTDDADQSRTGVILTSPVASAPISTLFATTGGCFLPLSTAALHYGIKKLDSYTIGSGTTGTAAFMLVKELARIPLLAQFVASERDLLFQLPSMPRIYDDACLAWLVLVGAAMPASSMFLGALDVVWG